MEVLAALNRILIFGGDGVEVVDCCDRIEALIGDSSFRPAEVPLEALADATKVLVTEGPKNVALAKALCGLLSACCVGDSPITKNFLLSDCDIVSVIDGLLSSSVMVPLAATPVLPTPLVVLAFNVLDLVATLSYNSGELRAALRPVVVKVPSVLLLLLRSLCQLSSDNSLLVKYSRGANPTVTEGGIVSVTGISGEVQRALKAHVDAIFGAVTTAMLLCVGDVRNGSTLLSGGCFITVLALYRALTPSAPPSARKGAPLIPLKGLDTSTFPRQALSEDSRKTLHQWCEQALRNLTLAAASIANQGEAPPPTLEAAIASASSEGTDAAQSVFGRMGENVDIDALKWNLQQAYRTATRKVAQ